MLIIAGCLEINSVDQLSLVFPSQNFQITVNFTSTYDESGSSPWFGAAMLPVGTVVNSAVWGAKSLTEDAALEAQLTADFPPDPGTYWWVGADYGSDDEGVFDCVIDLTVGSTTGAFLIDYHVGYGGTYEDSMLDVPLTIGSLNDSDGDGIIGPSDGVRARLEIAGMPQIYPNVIPQVFDTLDLDKDGIPGPNDKTLLDVMFTGGDRASGYPSSPIDLVVTDSPAAPVLVGATTHVTLSVENAAGIVPNSGGFAVVFWIESGSATLLGGEGTDLAGAPDNRYDVSGPSASGALANIVIRVDAPGPITLRAAIPACGTYPNGRWLDEAILDPAVVINGP